MMRLLFVLAVLCVIAAGVFEWAWSAWDGPGMLARSGKETVAMVAPHTRVHDIAQTLEQMGALKSAVIFEPPNTPFHRAPRCTLSPTSW
ncbi:MAG: hypothetical protein NTX21_05215 [Alphaproteobacteria bacterium]|nr:hypothetical protein [Alphaproteobacteria bacterium]